MSYEIWNERLASSFFNPAHAGKRVYLHVTPEKLNALVGNEHGLTDFIAAIKVGPVGFSGTICEKALATRRNWRDRRVSLPPYLASLCFFALAADHEGDWPAHAYYPRLWHLLGDPDYGRPQGFELMRELWRDLETWSIVHREGALGIFKAQIAGRRANVGLPIAQTILTEEERRRLPELFEASDLEPGAILAPDALAAAIVAHSASRLRRRTQILLATTDESDYRAELFEILQTELAEWDGTLATGSDETTPASSRAGLRLWLPSIDAAGFVKSRLVASLPETMEAGDLLLACQSFSGKQFECPARSGPCSGALRDSASGEEIKAEQLPWDSRVEFKCVLNGTRLILPAARLRIFINALELAHLGGFIETRLIPLTGEFYIAACGPETVLVARWGSQHCGEWREVATRSGLPANWRLFRGAGPRSPGSLGARYSIFQTRTASRIRFEGGIRAGSGTRYFQFALPDIIVDSANPLTALRFNDTILADPQDGRYAIPHNLTQPVNVIDATFDDHETHEVLYVLSDGWTWRNGEDCIPSGEFGQPSTTAGTRIRGADVQCGTVPEYIPDPKTAEENPAVLIGAVPGQIADLRRGTPLPPWPPVWMVSIRRREVVFSFCGNSIAAADPQPGHVEGSAKKWSGLLWNTRKRTKPMRTARLQALLRTYQEVAHAL